MPCVTKEQSPCAPIMRSFSDSGDIIVTIATRMNALVRATHMAIKQYSSPHIINFDFQLNATSF